MRLKGENQGVEGRGNAADGCPLNTYMIWEMTSQLHPAELVKACGGSGYFKLELLTDVSIMSNKSTHRYARLCGKLHSTFMMKVLMGKYGGRDTCL